MENNILILEESNIHQLTRLNLPMYSQILVTTSQQDGKISILTAKILLAIQLQHQLNIQLLVNAALAPDMNIFWAWLLGKLAATEPDAQITVLSNSSQEHQPLIELCSEHHPSVQLLQVMDETKKKSDESVQVVAIAPSLVQETGPIAAVLESNNLQITVEQEKATIVMPIKAEPAAAVLTDIHSVELTEKRSEIAEMIKEKEERKLKNEQIINALMKKVSEFPYKIIESKPVSSLMQDQVVDPNSQILLG
ncbi:hypothetical protein [uncultured Tolumonas sp.]|uniref:hypothetical protein n=1 Tax=uncultured Tolumonas sp. TaxID=263765 RepID=UPI00292CF427|nr:hypothetical protein [uncultured Tolumonas sp.]